MGKTVESFVRTYDLEYSRIVGRTVRQMEKEVKKLLSNHHELTVGQAWYIVELAYKNAYKNIFME